MYVSSQCLHSLDTVHYKSYGPNWHVLIYKAILNLLYIYQCNFIHLKNAGSYLMCSVTYIARDLLLLSVGKVHLETGYRLLGLRGGENC